MKHALLTLCISAISCLTHNVFAQKQPKEIISTRSYSIYPDSIIQQNKYVAKVISEKEITSDYKSPANLFKSPQITFKFSINGKDNEMTSGMDHSFICIAKEGTCETPIIKFGSQLKDSAGLAGNTYLAPATKLRIRVDMGNVFGEFEKQGFYTTFKGDKLYKEDFKGVYVAGNTTPLIWDFDNLVNHRQLQLKDEDGDHIYETTLLLNAEEDEKKTDSHWQLLKDISAFPQYKSAYTLSDALYNMSLEEMTRAVEPDSTFRTGKEWSGVWTRDISYSIILSMAYLQPRVAMKSLLRKVNKKGRIIQDTGTGGAYPCSTDRMIWAVAAWEIYKATGDKDWLQQAYLIIKNSIEDDLNVAYDSVTGLVKGESSFLDWREQTYPKWMQPADIFESECLGTNAVHYEANHVLAEMALLMNDKKTSDKHHSIASQIKHGINKYLWLPEKGYYAQYLYGRNYKIVSPRAEALGEALCVLWDIADKAKQKQILQRTPVTDFGITCIYPQIPGIPPYHNNAVWPFVQTYWMWAAVKAGNEEAVLKSVGDIYRPAAMFLTNKENFVAENGDFSGTQINSSNMLWSLSGNISLVHKVLFGIRFSADGLAFEPFVPRALTGKRSLTNFKYRKAILNIEMEGYGHGISAFTMDGKSLSKASVPPTLEGLHTIHIKLDNKSFDRNTINTRPVGFTLPAPNATLTTTGITWQPVAGAVTYSILKNGKKITETMQNSLNLTKDLLAEYQVIALDKDTVPSFASEPVLVIAEKNVSMLEAESFSSKADYNYKGFSGVGFTELSTTINRVLKIPVNIQTSGWYSIDFRYANGNGPVNTENKCAIRTLKVDNVQKGTVVFPQRGTNEWSNWGFSNAVKVYLSTGIHSISLTYEIFNDNMNGLINQSMVDYVRISRAQN